jgi:hypothetical protein
MPQWAADFKEGRMREAVRRYKNPNRHDAQYVYRSVTNVTGALPKMALLNWRSKITAEAAVREHEAWINMLGDEKQTAEERQIKWLSQAHYRTSSGAAAFGTTVHAVIENMMQGKTYEVEGLVEPWVASAVKFVQEARPRAERTETSVYDERSLTAGTFDLLGRLDAAPELGRVLIDWKTSKAVYPDQAVQLVGGYLLGAQYILDDDGKEHEWREPDNALIVHFTDKGYAIHRVPKDKQLRRAFLGALEIRKWEDEGEDIEKPYQLQLDLDGPQFSNMPSSAELAHLRSRLKALDHTKQLQISNHAHDLGIETNTKRMTVSDYDKLLGLLSLYEAGEQVTEPAPTRRRIMRPMP